MKNDQVLYQGSADAKHQKLYIGTYTADSDMNVKLKMYSHTLQFSQNMVKGQYEDTSTPLHF